MDTKQYILSPEEAHEAEQKWRVVKRSVDARQRELKVHLTVLTDDEGKPINLSPTLSSREGGLLYEPPVFQDVHNAERQVIIIGCGPAGLFAALTLLEHGIKPIIYERGKEVSERKKDIALLNRNEGLNEESNYCFGEGGAGTFSDGKLFSRSKKRGNMQRVMELFHYFGAPDSVLYEAHAHIGSDKLPGIIKKMRECILEHGGEIHFETCVTSLKDVQRDNVQGTKGITPIILAIGHSAHDTYRMLAAEGVAMETKGFAMGVRAEHPQALINKLMYFKGRNIGKSIYRNDSICRKRLLLDGDAGRWTGRVLVLYVSGRTHRTGGQQRRDMRGERHECQPSEQSLCQLRHGCTNQSGGHPGR